MIVLFRPGLVPASQLKQDYIKGTAAKAKLAGGKGKELGYATFYRRGIIVRPS